VRFHPNPTQRRAPHSRKLYQLPTVSTRIDVAPESDILELSVVSARTGVQCIVPCSFATPDSPPCHLTLRPRLGTQNFSAFAGSGNSRSVGVKNQSASEILRFAVFLRSAAGRRTSERVNPRQIFPVVKRDGLDRIRAVPSVQGGWRPGMFSVSEK